MKHIKEYEEFINESKFPDEVIGNDDIVWKKKRETSGTANYEPYWHGYSIDFGGVNFSSPDRLNAFIKDYVLSNNWYNKLKHLPVKKIDENLNEDLSATISDPEIEAAWSKVYGKELKDDFPHIFKILKQRRAKIDSKELERIWSEVHEKSFKEEHPKVWNILFSDK